MPNGSNHRLCQPFVQRGDGKRVLGALLLAVGACCAVAFTAAAAPARCSADRWPQWQAFAQHFIQQDGRVVDASTPQKHSTSEGQSYAMFFALVANDRDSFQRVWHWSRDNLIAGQQGTHLPAWEWGQADDGSWRVLDTNSAADADLWFAYALIEASRLWQRPDYRRDGMDLLHAVASEEAIRLPGLGWMLLPGRSGFADQEGVWRFNPSYEPLPLLRRFAAIDRHGPWHDMIRNLPTLLSAFPQTRLTPDWIAYRLDAQGKGGFFVDPKHGDRGSYDAIRSYLWAGITAPRDPLASRLLQLQKGMVALVGADPPPENVHVASGEHTGTAPFGFSAALAPYLDAMGEQASARAQQQRAEAQMELAGREAAGSTRQPPYYDYVLSLFGLGWEQGRYRLLASGELQPGWNKACLASASH